ncbi:MAG: hypothetical protein AAFO89_15050 [Planctomycetota bacterium]
MPGRRRVHATLVVRDGTPRSGAPETEFTGKRLCLAGSAGTRDRRGGVFEFLHIGRIETPKHIARGTTGRSC